MNPVRLLDRIYIEQILSNRKMSVRIVINSRQRRSRSITSSIPPLVTRRAISMSQRVPRFKRIPYMQWRSGSQAQNAREGEWNWKHVEYPFSGDEAIGYTKLKGAVADPVAELLSMRITIGIYTYYNRREGGKKEAHCSLSRFSIPHLQLIPCFLTSCFRLRTFPYRPHDYPISFHPIPYPLVQIQQNTPSLRHLILNDSVRTL
ncbi:hypothetical protein BZA77DRAFT_46939 [Pyronema omphalodes]|nr:hypothetical protein BZA77DRAFT_46939 [Pyronema omphalodes]